MRTSHTDNEMELVKKTFRFKRAVKAIRNDSVIPELLQRYFNRPYLIGHYVNFVKVKEFCEGNNLLDIGCGTGWATTLYKKWGCRKVVGIDINHKNIMFATKFRSKENIEFGVGDCRDIKVSDNQFDIATCFEVIEHIKEWETVIDEAKRVLKGNGHLFLSTPNIIHYNNIGWTNPEHITNFSWDTFTEMFQRKLPDATFYCRYGEDIGASEEVQGIRLIAEKNQIIAAIIGKNANLLSKVIRRVPIRLQRWYFENTVGLDYNWLCERHIVYSRRYRLGGKEPFGFYLHWQKAA